MMVVAGLGLAAPIVAPPELETLVEGHTVFTVVEQVNVKAEKTEMYAAAVAVVVREVNFSASSFRYPGVLWFNDQYLVNPQQSANSGSAVYRYPCFGAVLAVPAGDPSPMADPNTTFNQSNYVESYRIRDPNDFTWTIDKWNDSGRFVWSVAILNDDTRYNQTDTGSNCPITRTRDNPCAAPVLLPWENEATPAPGNDSGPADRRTISPCSTARLGFYSGAQSPSTDNGYNYPCGGRDTSPKPTCSAVIEYNALLFFFLEDLTVAGPVKNHTDGSTDRQRDVSGCDWDHTNTSVPSYTNWPCPAADDDREGNSHAYNPERPYPAMTYAGRNNHGGSADCTGDAVGDQYCHATRKVDIYFGRAEKPITRVYRIDDTEGVTAPYHCHEHMTLCNQNDVFALAGRDSPQ